VADLEVPLPCGAGGVKGVAGDRIERRKAPNYDVLPFGEGLMAASQLLHTRQPHLIQAGTRNGAAEGADWSHESCLLAEVLHYTRRIKAA